MSTCRNARAGARAAALGAGALVLSALLLPVPVSAQAPPQNCTARFQSAFSQLSQRRDLASTQRASSEVSNVFGPPAASCEPGAYQSFMDSYLELASRAIRASAKGQHNQIYLATAIAGQIPLHVPAEGGKAALDAFRQTRSTIYAIADDVKPTAQIKELLETFDRSGPPVVDPPLSMVYVPGGGTPPPTQGSQGGTATPGGPGTPPVVVQPVRVPNVPLPSWAVLSIFEAREALKAKDMATAQKKLDDVLRWMEKPGNDY